MDPTTPESGAGTNPDEVLLDVREMIAAGEEPFGTIMQTVASLEGRIFVLVAPFEPTPLFGVLSSQGFTYESEQLGEAEWRVRFTPPANPVDTASPQDGQRAESGDGQAPPPTAPSGTSPGAAPGSAAATPSEGGPAASPFTIKRRTTATDATSPTDAEARGRTAAGATPSVPSVMAMNPTLNVPPAWLPLGFMAAAGAGLIAFGVAVAVTAQSVVTIPRYDHVIAAVHFGVLAFLSTAVLGALHQFGPVVGARPLRSVPAGVVTGILFVPGVWLIPTGFATGHLGVLQTGGVMASLAVCLAAWNVSKPLAASGKGTPIIGLRLAVVYLVLTVAFGIVYAFDRGATWFALLPNRVLAHAHLGLLGWLGLAYVAVAEKLWPMFLLAHRPHARDGERAVWLVGAGAPLVTVGLLWEIRVLATLGGVLVLLGLGFHLLSLTSVIRHRRRNLELLHGFVLASAVCLVTAMVIGVVAGVAPMDIADRSRLVTAEVFSLILWLALAVIGHAHKIVPFISWNRLRARGITTGRDGRPLLFAHLVEPTVARVTFAFAVLGAAAGVIGALAATSALVAVAGVSLAAAGVTATANLASGPLLMIRWHTRRSSTPVTSPRVSAARPTP